MSDRISRIPTRISCAAEKRSNLYELFPAAMPRGDVASAPAPDGRAATQARPFFTAAVDGIADFIVDVIERPRTAIICIWLGMASVVVPAIIVAWVRS